jgi:hypothetical protein
MKKFCPRWTHRERRSDIQITDDEDGKTVTETVIEYESLICDESCALYEFRPKCIFGV